MQLRVATIGGAHGLRGDVKLALHTDEPEARFAAGSVLATDPPTAGPLTVEALRRQQTHWYVRFAGITDRTGAEALRGVVLLAEPRADESEADAWYPHELAGLAAFRPSGAHLGQIEGIEYLPAQDVLVLREVTGERTLIPFVSAIVPVVDVPGGRVVIDAPGGLLAQDGFDEDSADPAQADTSEETGE